MLPLQRLFVVPASPKQKEIPFARVNHNKYMVTDKIAYIGKAAPALHYVKHSWIPTCCKFFNASSCDEHKVYSLMHETMKLNKWNF